MLTTERVLSLGFILFGVFFFIMSLSLESRPNVVINPGSWPAFLTAMTILLGSVLLLRTFKKQQIDVSEENKEVEELLEEEKLVYPQNFYYLLILFIIYTALINYLGFIVTTILVLVWLYALFGMRSWSHRIITAVVSTAAFIVIFPMLLSTPFPRGVGIFRTFSLLFY